MEFEILRTSAIKVKPARGKYKDLLLAIKALKYGQSIFVPADDGKISLYRANLYSYQCRKLMPRVHINRCEGGLAIRLWD